MIIADLKNVILLRQAVRFDFPADFLNPVRVGEWLVASDGTCFVAYKSKEPCDTPPGRMAAAKPWLDADLGTKAMPLNELKMFAGKRKISAIDGRKFDMDIFADFIAFIDAKTYRFAFFRTDARNEREPMWALQVGDDTWRVMLMGMKGELPDFCPYFTMEG